MKIQRHAKILEIIHNHNIETQEELTEKLKDAGFKTTQATISRDIKELRLIKVAGENGNYKYSINLYDDDVKTTAKYRNILSETITKADIAGNIVVLNTYSGMAQAAAAAIDAMDFNEIVGTLAGDDTIFLAFRSEHIAMSFSEKIKNMLAI